MKNNLFYVLCFLFLTSCNKEKKAINTQQSTIAEKPLFSLLTEAESGFYFKNEINQTEDLNILTYANFFNGGGVGVGDINNDDLPDLFLTGNFFGGRLYLNKGNLQFEQISESARIFTSGFTSDVSFVDINNDGYQDIYLCKTLSIDPKVRKNVLYINNKDNTFTDMAEVYGVADSGYSNQSVFFDYDNDGDLDLYVMNHRKDFENAQSFYDSKASKGNVLPSDKFWDDVSADRLYRNNGNNSFTDVTRISKISNNDFSLSAVASDLNNDGLTDLYISNDFISKDHAYINQGDGTFKDKIDDMFAHIPRSAMGTDIADFNNDGLLDVINVDMTPRDNFRHKQLKTAGGFDSNNLTESYGFHRQINRNMLQINNGDNTFSEIGQLANIAHTDWSWAPLLADFDNDGFKDLFISNGYYKNVTDLDYVKYKSVEAVNKAGGLSKVSNTDLIKLMSSTPISNYAYKNTGNSTFKDQTKNWGLATPSFSNGSIYADLDLDGDLELIVNNFNQEAFLYKNNSREQGKGNYISIKLRGGKGNLNGLGSKVTIYTKEGLQTQECTPYRGFLSSGDTTLHFGLGVITIIDKIEVIWPNGKKQVLTNVKGNQLLTLNIKNAKSYKEKSSLIDMPFLKRVQQKSKFNHIENPYIDFKQEPLLEHFLSNKGPVLTSADVNNDMLNDLYIGGSSGTPGKLLIQNVNGTFIERQNIDFINDKNFEDAASAFLDINNDGHLDLYVSSGSNEFYEGDNYQDRLYLNDGEGNFKRSKDRLPQITTSTSCVTPIDFDNDGDLDLFVGGFAKKNKYPLFEKSWLLQNDNGYFKDKSEWLPNNGKIGIVNDAVSISSSELIVVGEWMEISILKKDTNNVFSIVKNNGLDQTSGWWNCIKAHDFDNDGDLDFIVGNRGLNSIYKASKLHPAKIYYGDFDSNNDLDAIPCYYNDVDKAYFPKHGLDQLFKQMKGIRKIFSNYASYSNASLHQIIPDQSKFFKADTFASVYIENLGEGKMKVTELPIEAQFSYVQDILIKDVNRDSFNDIIITGNNFGVDSEMGKSDGSKGLVLLYQDNRFKGLTPKESGLSTLNYDAREIVQISDNLIGISNNNGPILFFEIIERKK